MSILFRSGKYFRYKCIVFSNLCPSNYIFFPLSNPTSFFIINSSSCECVSTNLELGFEAYIRSSFPPFSIICRTIWLLLLYPLLWFQGFLEIFSIFLKICSEKNWDRSTTFFDLSQWCLSYHLNYYLKENLMVQWHH